MTDTIESLAGDLCSILLEHGHDVKDALSAISDHLTRARALGPEWQAISTVPKDCSYVVTEPRGPEMPWRLTLSQPVALLCLNPTSSDDEGDEPDYLLIRGCWSTKDSDGCLWNLDGHEPLDLDVLGWMPFPQPPKEPGQ